MHFSFTKPCRFQVISGDSRKILKFEFKCFPKVTSKSKIATCILSLLGKANLHFLRKPIEPAHKEILMEKEWTGTSRMTEPEVRGNNYGIWESIFMGLGLQNLGLFLRHLQFTKHNKPKPCKIKLVQHRNPAENKLFWWFPETRKL